MPLLRDRRVYRFLALFWTVTLVVGLSLPRDAVPDLGLFSFDKVIHASIFALFTALWMLASSGRWRRRATRVLVAAVILAGLTEWLQGALAGGRTPDVYDAVANITGAVLVILLSRFWLRRRRRRVVVRGSGSKRSRRRGHRRQGDGTGHSGHRHRSSRGRDGRGHRGRGSSR